MIYAESAIRIRHRETHLGKHHHECLFCKKGFLYAIFRHKKVHTKQGFTNHAVGRTIYNTICTRKLASYLLNHFFFVDFFFLAIELSDSDSYIHFTNFLDTDMHSPMILRGFDFISLHFVLLCLLQFPWKAEHAP